MLEGSLRSTAAKVFANHVSGAVLLQPGWYSCACLKAIVGMHYGPLGRGATSLSTA